MLDDVPIVGNGVLDDDLFVDLAIQAKPWVPLVVQGVGEVALQVHAVQSVRCGRRENTACDWSGS